LTSSISFESIHQTALGILKLTEGGISLGDVGNMPIYKRDIVYEQLLEEHKKREKEIEEERSRRNKKPYA